MFRKSNKYINYQTSEKLFNIIGINTRIDGNMSALGNVRIDGILLGKLKTAARLVVGLTGYIDGVVVCKNADIIGTIKGILSASNLIRLKPSAQVEGIISCKRIIISEGALIKNAVNFNKEISNMKQLSEESDIKSEIYDALNSFKEKYNEKEEAAKDQNTNDNLFFGHELRVENVDTK